MYCLDFDKCVHSCNYPHIKMQNIFITSKAPLCFFYSQSLQPAWPQPTLICFEFKDQFIFSKFPMNGTIKYQNVLFCTWLLSFSKMYLKFIPCCCVQLQLVPLYLFIFLPSSSPFHAWVFYNLYIYLPADGLSPVFDYCE